MLEVGTETFHWDGVWGEVNLHQKLIHVTLKAYGLGTQYGMMGGGAVGNQWYNDIVLLVCVVG